MPFTTLSVTCDSPEHPSPENRRANAEFEALLLEFDPAEYAGEIGDECKTGSEPECPPEVQLASRLRDIGPNLVDWLTDLGASAFEAAKEGARKLAVNSAVAAALVLPVVVAAPEATVGITVARGGLLHAAGRHSFTSSVVETSKFLPTFSTNEALIGLVTIATRYAPTTLRWQGRNGEWRTANVRVIELTETVGYDFMNGNAPTRFFTVWTNLGERLSTIHPGLPTSVLTGR